MSHLTLEVPRDSILNLHSVRNVLGQPELVFRLVAVPCAPHHFPWDMEHPQILDPLDLLDLLQQIRSHREAEPEEMLRHCGGFTGPGTWHLWGREETHQRGAVFRVPWRYSCREQKNPPVPLLTWKLLSHLTFVQCFWMMTCELTGR